MSHMPPRSALQVLKNFRIQQLERLPHHLRIFGPLPTVTEAVVSLSSSNPNGSGTVAEPSIVLPNPFIPRKNPKTGKWRCPKYSLRRQADLVKKAKETDNLAIMPPGPKMFALELRMRRLRTASSPIESAILAAAQTSLDKRSPKPSPAQPHFSTFDTQLRERQDKLAALEQDLEQRQTQHELDELAAFEKSESEADLRDRTKRQAEYSSLQVQMSMTRSEVNKAGQKLHTAKVEYEMSKATEAAERLWTNPFWAGDTKKKTTKGEELGVKLYAGKKKMFKGHTWEKERSKRRRRQSILMRDMKARIARYKSFYKKRKPNPLKPSRLSKPRKLPF